MSYLDCVTRIKNKLVYTNGLVIQSFSIKELKFILWALDQLRVEVNIDIFNYRKYIKKIIVDKNLDSIAEYDINDLNIHISYQKLKKWIKDKDYVDFKLTLLHEFTHAIDYPSDFFLSELVLDEYKKFITLFKKEINSPELFKYNTRENIIDEYWDGLPAFAKMSNDKYLRLSKKYEKKVKKLGYPSFYSTYCVQEFLAEALSGYLLRTYTPKKSLRICLEKVKNYL